MRGKRKQILSLALVLAMVAQLFAGLGNVAKASSSSATEVTITGRHTQNDVSANGETPEQIGFAVNGTIKDGNWYNATITSGAVKKNGEEQSGWKVQVTGASTFNLICSDYTPQVNDTITIPAGTQFTINDTDDVYQITNDYTIQFDEYGWRVAPEYTTDITIKQLGGGHHDYTSDTKQIGFDINEAISIGTSYWGNNSYMTYGSIMLNNNAQSTWYIFSTKISDFVLVCPNYTAANGDIIKFLAGTQFTCEGSGYEITKDFAIKWDGTTWEEYVEPIEATPITITGRFNQFDASATGTTPEQIGFTINGAIAGADNWPNGSITQGSILLNDAGQSDWTLQATGAGTFNLVCWNYTPAVGDIITLPAGTQFTIANTIDNRDDVYNITNENVIKYDGTTWTEYVEPIEATPITITGRFNQFDASATGTTPEQIGFTIDGTIAGADNWPNGSITQGSILLNDAGQSDWTLQATGAGTFNLVCWNYTPAVGDIITLPAGTQFTIANTIANTNDVYEIKNDYTIKYDGHKWGVLVTSDASIAITERNPNSDASAAGTTPEQIGFAINGTIEGGDNWPNGFIVQGSFLLNDEVRGDWHLQATGTNSLNLVCWNYTPVETDIIKIPADMQFTCNGKVYEITEAIGIIYHDGEWVLDRTTITYRGEELIEGAQYGLRIGNTKQEIEALFSATDGIQRSLEIAFTYPQEMYDADDKFQAGTYQVKVSATSYSGITTEYNITVKGFTKDAPTISYEGEPERMADSGKKFDVSSLKAVAKDGNGKTLDIQYKYSEGALDGAGALNKGEHVLHLMAVDDEGQSFTRKIKLICYEMTDIVIKGFYLQIDDSLFIATNMKNPEKFKTSGFIQTDDILINGKSDVITWITVDEHSGSLYMIIKPNKGDVLTIAGGTTFLDHENYIGIRTLNAFKGHTDGIGWIKDRLPNNGFGATDLSNSSDSSDSFTSPATGDGNQWIAYLVLCILLIPVMVVLYRRRKFGYEEQ